MWVRVAVCPFVTAISPSILARSLQKIYTIKSRHSIPWLVLGVTIRQILAIFWPKMLKKLQVLVTAISLSVMARSPQENHTMKNRHSIPWLVFGVTIRQIFSYFLARNVQKIANCDVGGNARF